jgi:hypothetical protein
MMKILTPLLFGFTLASCASSGHDFALDQPASEQPQLIGAGVVSDGMDQRDCALSFDQQHFLYTLQMGRSARIMHAHRSGSGWSTPTTVSFSGKWRDLEPVFQPQTMLLYFVSNRPVDGGEEAGEFNIWRTRWTNASWQQPEHVGDLDGVGNEFYPSLTESGDVYFTAEREGGVGGEDLWFAEAAGDGFLTAVPLGAGVNTTGGEFNAAIDPTGSYLIFGGARADGLGGGDLYLSKRNADGTWGAAVLMAGSINTPQLDFCPMFRGTDGEIWFTSRRPLERDNANDLPTLRKQWQAPGNGLGDLYRVKIELP